MDRYLNAIIIIIIHLCLFPRRYIYDVIM